jgi:hypothetical protein
LIPYKPETLQTTTPAKSKTGAGKENHNSNNTKATGGANTNKKARQLLGI